MLTSAGIAFCQAPAIAPTGTIELTAALIDISQTTLVATGSPRLTSSQGTITAPRFSVALDGSGHATEAVATGGVHFDLVAPTGSYRSISGVCDHVVLYPAKREAVLSGSLAATFQGTGLAPMKLNGAGAHVYAAIPGRPAHIQVTDAQGLIPAHS